MTPVLPEDQATTQIAASPDAVWRAVSDITRMGEWSPETIKAFWIGPKKVEKGAIFMGINKDGRWRWPGPAIVTESEPGRVFEFRAVSGVTWRYTTEASGDGTQLTEQRITSGEFSLMVKTIYRFMGGYDRRKVVLRHGLQETVDRIKTVLERQNR